MSNQVKERNEIEEQYRWDLSTLYASDEAFEEDFAKLDACIAKVAAFQGKLTDAASLKACFEADTELDLLLSDLFCYANLRRSEDTRAEDAQALYMRIYGKYVEAMTLTSFVRPEVLALPEETLQAIRDDEQMADYAYTAVTPTQMAVFGCEGNLVAGANIAGFLKVAEAMKWQGIAY